jgi:hypothetical protein
MRATETRGRYGHRAMTIAVGSLVAAGFLAAVAWLPRSYQATAEVALTGRMPDASAQIGSGAGGAASPVVRTADLVSRDLMSVRTMRILAARGSTQSYAVGLDPRWASSAVLDITVTGSDPGKLQAMLSALVSRLQMTLTRLPSRARPAGGIQAVPLAADLRPALTASAATRPLLAIGIFAAVLILGCPVVVDARRGRRRRTAGLTAKAPVEPAPV